MPVPPDPSPKAVPPRTGTKPAAGTAPAAGAGPATDEPTTDYSAFEGMFVRACKPDGTFAAELKAIGFDLAHPLPRYPTRIWRDSLEVARKRLFPGMTAAQGSRALGKLFIDGFFTTITGRFIQVALPFLGPAGVLKRTPKFWQMTRTGVTVDVVEESPTSSRLLWRDPFPNGEFSAGILEGGLKGIGRNVAITIPTQWPSGFELLVTWDK